jgi:hypothetical protein
MTSNFHEAFAHEVVTPPPARSTGLVFTAAALIVAILWRHNASVVVAALSIAAVLCFVSIWRPRLLAPLNIAWFRLALALNAVMSPLVMAVIFAVAIVPFGFALQLLSDPLRKKRNPDAKTYWLQRDATSNPPSSMINQF